MNLIHKEFLIAVANGEEVECKRNPAVDEWFLVDRHHSLAAFDNSSVDFRIKPKTVTISYEIPMPFAPKFGEEYWCIDASSNSLISRTANDPCSIDKRIATIGAYRTKQEVLQALEAQKAAIAKLLEGAK